MPEVHILYMWFYTSDNVLGASQTQKEVFCPYWRKQYMGIDSWLLIIFGHFYSCLLLPSSPWYNWGTLNLSITKDKLVSNIYNPFTI